MKSRFCRIRYILTLILVMGLSWMMTGCDSVQQMIQNGPAVPMHEEGTAIYYMNNDGSGLLHAHYSLASTGDTAVSELFQVLRSGQYNDGRTAIPEGCSLERSAWQEKSLVLYLSGSYPEVGTVEEILCRSALVCTMSQVEDVSGVTIYVNGQPLKNTRGSEIGIMTAETFLTDVIADNKEEYASVTLYFANDTGDLLVPERVLLRKTSEQSLEVQIMNQLIEGPKTKECFSSMPVGTKVNSVMVQNGICYVNLDTSFTAGTLTMKDYIPVYSIVNSLTGLSEVNSVQLLIDGSSDVIFGESISFATPLEANMDYVR